MAAYAAIAADIEERTTKDRSFETEGERKSRISKARIMELQKDKKNAT